MALPTASSPPDVREPLLDAVAARIRSRLDDHVPLAQHLAHRQTDPHDKREVDVTVDLAGLAARDNVYLGIGAAFDRLHATYTTDQLRFLIHHLETAIEITRARTAALHPSADPPTRGPRRHP
ncbi:hypothetical protein [Candidatus Frankia nodulisporulans]|uniref:hypothetical protein n=2 Tax=Candidatus Frankia nodulisporulans TaxID=2060052 RepID=UPI001581A29B|nr:hypothetical protein [Candidatus Frankia nodulisporulans]